MNLIWKSILKTYIIVFVFYSVFNWFANKYVLSFDARAIETFFYEFYSIALICIVITIFLTLIKLIYNLILGSENFEHKELKKEEGFIGISENDR